MLKRLEQFAQPFMASFGRREPKENTRIYMCGLLSDLKRKNIESIAYRYDQDRRALQQFMGSTPWDHQSLQQELARQVGVELGEEDGVIVFDPSGFKKCGTESVGIQRQRCQDPDMNRNQRVCAGGDCQEGTENRVEFGRNPANSQHYAFRASAYGTSTYEQCVAKCNLPIS